MSTVMTWQTNTIGSDETESLGQELGQLLKPPILIELRSDLGGGKTTFVRGVAKGAGSTGSVTSPTFTLNQIYKTKDGTQISHHDFYRLADAGIMADELKESLEDSKTITVVEWGDIVSDVLPAEHLVIEFKPLATNNNERQITITYPQKYAELISALETNWAKLRP